jgi:exopolyphosphatase/guanosine-5'-triphosphate,3'-diphosphate pyrophosphatase
MRIAVIDLGTNTFNLLVAEVFPDNTYKTLYKKKFASKLGEGGINKGLIQPIPFSRGIEALKAHQETILSYQVDKTYAIATLFKKQKKRPVLTSPLFLATGKRSLFIMG